MARVVEINALQLLIDKAYNTLLSINTIKKKIVWFGLTDHIDIVQKVLISRGKRIHFIIDNADEKQGLVLEDDLIVFPPNQIINRYMNNACYLVSSKFKEEMHEQLIKKGVNSDNIVFLPYHDECDEWAVKELYKEVKGLKKIEHRESQLLMLELLKSFRDYCNSNGLRYFLAAGTLIGAVRNKGFIPWDDDADVYMPENDYLQFIKRYPIGGQYEVVNWSINPERTPHHSQFVDNRTVKLVTYTYPQKRLSSISMCVFPLSGYSNDKITFEQNKRRNDLLNIKWFQNKWVLDFCKNVPDFRYDIERLKFLTLCDNSPRMGKTHGMSNTLWTVPSWVFESTTPIEFEGEIFSAPIGYDEYLKTHYGNYMQLPPKDKQVNHEFVGYWKKEVQSC